MEIPFPDKDRFSALILCDVHIPYHDRKAIQAMYDYFEGREAPEVIVLLGDILDFYSISHWAKDPKSASIDTELLTCVNFLSDLTTRFRNATILMLSGNHEARLRRYLWDKAPELSCLPHLELSELLGLKQYGIHFIDPYDYLEQYKRPFSIHDLMLFHGDELKISASSVNVARTVFLKTYENSLVGHFHKSSEFVQKTVAGRVLGSWTVGCMCDLYPRYMPINNWSHGFALATFESKSLVDVQNVQIQGGKVMG